MALNNPYAVYKNNSVNYASKEQLLLMLLEGAVRFSKTGRQAILDKNIQKAHENIVKTQNIFYELLISLNVEQGGEWAKSMVDIYNFILRRLTDANMKKDAAIMDELIPLIEEIKNTWEEAYKISKSTK